MISGRTKSFEKEGTHNFFVTNQSTSNILPNIQQFTKTDDSLRDIVLEKTNRVREIIKGTTLTFDMLTRTQLTSQPEVQPQKN